MKNFWKNWDFMRLVRLVMGIIIIAQGTQLGDWSFVALGGLFTLMPLLNIGCCGAGGCQIPTQRASKQNSPSEVLYEEVGKTP